jgi:GTP-binding protein EngB required for normal cell division
MRRAAAVAARRGGGGGGGGGAGQLLAARLDVPDDDDDDEDDDDSERRPSAAAPQKKSSKTKPGDNNKGRRTGSKADATASSQPQQQAAAKQQKAKPQAREQQQQQQRPTPVFLDESSPFYQPALTDDDLGNDPPGHRSGYVAVIGRPNAGKSTLINALVGQKLCAVSPRPQTTRHRVVGLACGPDHQMVLFDTPGIVKEQRSRLEERMMAAVVSSIRSAEAIVAVVDAGESFCVFCASGAASRSLSLTPSLLFFPPTHPHHPTQPTTLARPWPCFSRAQTGTAPRWPCF